MELSDKDIETLQRVLNAVKNISGPGVSMSGGESISIHAPPVRIPPPPGEKWRWVKLTSTAGGAGLYNARHQKVIAGPNETPTTDFLASNFFADVRSSDDCLFRNLNESGNAAGSHALTANGNQYILARRAPVDTTDSPPKPVYEENVGGSLPAGTGIYKVLMLLDNANPGTPGWDYPSFHS